MAIELTIGADPEVFVVDTDQNLVPAYGLIPGTKDAPEECPDGATQVDGLALEFNITPARSEDEFVYKINSVFNTLKSKLPSGLSPLVLPYVSFPGAVYDKLPREATQLGCDPDYNVWDRPELARALPDAISESRGRGAAGHIHIGWTNGADIYSESHWAEVTAMLRQVDILWTYVYSPIEPASGRQNWYGQRGVFRPKHYGVEFRTPSNSWLSSEALTRLAYRIVNKAATDLIEGHEYWVSPNENLRIGAASEMGRKWIDDLKVGRTGHNLATAMSDFGARQKKAA